MSTLTIRLPDDKHQRLKLLAKKRKLSVNKLIEEISTILLAEFDTESHFRVVAAKGSVNRALAILNKLDKHFDKKKKE